MKDPISSLEDKIKEFESFRKQMNEYIDEQIAEKQAQIDKLRKELEDNG